MPIFQTIWFSSLRIFNHCICGAFESITLILYKSSKATDSWNRPASRTRQVCFEMCILLYCLLRENSEVFNQECIRNDGHIRKRFLLVSCLIVLCYDEEHSSIFHQPWNNKNIYSLQ